MKFKQYEQIQENKFNLKSRAELYCDLNKVSNDENWDNNEYGKKIRDNVLSFQDNLYDYLVKNSWLHKKFIYDGMPMRNKSRRSHGTKMDGAFSMFMRYYNNLEPTIIGLSPLFSHIVSYFDDFYPDFEAMNPFEEEIKMPYKHLTLEYLLVVYKMKQRLELLDYAEEKRMRYSEFLDYVWNWTTAFNLDKGRDIYTFSHAYLPQFPMVHLLDKKYGK